MQRHQFATVLLSPVLGLIINAASIEACPRDETFGEAFNRYDTVAIGEFVDATQADQRGWATATFRIKQVFQGTGASDAQLVTVSTKQHSKVGDVAVLVADRKWKKAVPDKPTFAAFRRRIGISPSAVRYVESLPRGEVAPAESLSFYIRFLEHDDEIIAADAYGRCSSASYSTLRTVSDQFPRESLRQWVASDQTAPSRLSLYGLMLGMCGDEQDEALLHSKIVVEADQFRVGMDGVVAGYLLIAGEKGLELIEKQKFLDNTIQFGETYSAMLALRIVWTAANDHNKDGGSNESPITKNRLRQSMRILLERTDLADLVIADLTRWSDWSQMDDIYALYDADGYNVPAIKRAIVRFFLVATRVKDDRPNQEQLAAAERYVAELKKIDPNTFKKTQQFFLLN